MAGSATGTGNIFEFNGHYYEFIDSSTLWHDARDYAASQTYNGITGSLIRIDSAEENAFILEYSKNHINGSDVEVSDANGVVVTLIGLGDADTSIDEQLIGVQQV